MSTNVQAEKTRINAEIEELKSEASKAKTEGNTTLYTAFQQQLVLLREEKNIVLKQGACTDLQLIGFTGFERCMEYRRRLAAGANNNF